MTRTPVGIAVNIAKLPDFVAGGEMTATRRKRPDWSRLLPRPLVIPEIMELRKLADVRELVEKHLPADYRKKDTWRHVAAQLTEAASGGSVMNASIALRLALMLDGVQCQPM